MPSREQLIAGANATQTHFIRLSELSDPVTTFMLRYWTAKKGDRRMPSPSDLSLGEFARYAPKIFTVQVQHEPYDLFFRLVGEDVITNFGFNPKSRALRSLDKELPGVGSLLHQFFGWVAQEGRPIGAGGTQELVDKSYNDYEAVYLPLSEDGVRVDRILAATSYFSNRSSTYRQDAVLRPFGSL